MSVPLLAPGGGRPQGVGAVRERLASSGMRLERAWPRGHDHLLLHVRPDAHSPGDVGPGAWVAGQWFADDARAAHVAARSRGAANLGGGVVLQPGGADRRLRGLAPLLREPDAELLVHRPERRAVVRHRTAVGTVFSKVVQPSRVPALERSARWVPAGVRVPQVLAVDADAGVVTTAALPGVTPVALDPGPGGDGTLARRAWQEVGRTVAALHAAPPPPDARLHGTDDEVAVTRTWLEHALRHRALAPRQVAGLWAASCGAAARLRGYPRGAGAPPATLHRDLHDKQVVIDPTADAGGGPAVALLDLDLVVVGEAALDVANLLCHLVLRDLQADLAGTGVPARAEERAGAFLAGYGDVAEPGRVHDLALVAAARVAAVYAFRAALPSLSPPSPSRPVPVPPGAAVQPPDVGGPELGERLVEVVRAGLPGGLSR